MSILIFINILLLHCNNILQCYYAMCRSDKSLPTIYNISELIHIEVLFSY